MLNAHFQQFMTVFGDFLISKTMLKDKNKKITRFKSKLERGKLCIMASLFLKNDHQAFPRSKIRIRTLDHSQSLNFVLL